MKPNLFVLLEKVRSAHNVGSVFRSCDGAGVDRLYLCGFCAVPDNPKLMKTALGSAESVAWEHHCDGVALARMLKTNGVRLVAVEKVDEAESVFEAGISADTCLVFGHEEAGVSQEMLELADEVVAIPQLGVKDSLNISVAAGVVVYEYRRKLLSLNG